MKSGMPTEAVNEYLYDNNTPHLKVVDTRDEISLAVSSMREVMNEEMGFALDSEHKVLFNGRGMRQHEHKIGLIQIAYFNRHANDWKQYLFVRTRDIDRLPGPLISLLASSVPIIGVNVGGNLARIAQDFALGEVIGRRPKQTVINLGTYARKRDVIQNGTIGMKELVKKVSGLNIDKNRHDILSPTGVQRTSNPITD